MGSGHGSADRGQLIDDQSRAGQQHPRAGQPGRGTGNVPRARRPASTITNRTPAWRSRALSGAPEVMRAFSRRACSCPGGSAWRRPGPRRSRSPGGTAAGATGRAWPRRVPGRAGGTPPTAAAVRCPGRGCRRSVARGQPGGRVPDRAQPPGRAPGQPGQQQHRRQHRDRGQQIAQVGDGGRAARRSSQAVPSPAPAASASASGATNCWPSRSTAKPGQAPIRSWSRARPGPVSPMHAIARPAAAAMLRPGQRAPAEDQVAGQRGQREQQPEGRPAGRRSRPARSGRSTRRPA